MGTYAIENQRFDIAALLLMNGAQVSAEQTQHLERPEFELFLTGREESPLAQALKGHDIKFSEALYTISLKQGRNSTCHFLQDQVPALSTSANLLIQASKLNNSEIVLALFAAQTSAAASPEMVIALKKTQKTALTTAIHAQAWQTAIALVEQLDPEHLNEPLAGNNTFLILASGHANFSIAFLTALFEKAGPKLLNHRVDMGDGVSQTALSVAIQAGNIPVITFLIDRGAILGPIAARKLLASELAKEAPQQNPEFIGLLRTKIPEPGASTLTHS